MLATVSVGLITHTTVFFLLLEPQWADLGMYKNSSITSFFKPFAQSRQNKRPLPNNDDLDVTLNQSPPSNRPTLGTTSHQPFRSHLPVSDSPLVEPRGVNGTPTSNEALPQIDGSENLGSKGPVLISGQRVVRDGEVMIRNSEDEASDSDISLDDIDDLLVPRKPEIKSLTEMTLPLSNQTNGPREMIRQRRTRVASQANAFPLPSHPVEHQYKFSFGALAKQRRDDEASEAQTAKARLLLQSLEHSGGRRVGGDVNLTDREANITAEVVASVIKGHGDGDDVDRLMTAIQRTEALHRGKSWSFFDPNKSGSLPEEVELPKVHSVRFQNISGEIHIRQQAFLTGYVGDMAAKGTLPDEIWIWVSNAMCFERRNDLRYSYRCTLKEAASQFALLLTPHRLDVLFRNIGASTEALDIGRPIVPLASLSQSNDSVDYARVLSVLGLLGDAAVHLAADSRTHALNVLCRLLLDKSVACNCRLMVAIEEAFASLVTSIQEERFDRELHTILNTVYPCIAEATLRLQLLQNVPTSSPRLSLLRRRLALAFFLDDQSYLQRSSQGPIDLKRIADCLETQRFTIHNNTDYAELGATVTLLSIGVDSGDPLFSDSDQDQEVAFNKAVDLLSDKVKAMFTQIVDTGASHVRRTEAKAILEGFYSRLQLAVRTKRKPRSLMFGSFGIDTVSNQKQTALIDRFLTGSKRTLDLSPTK